MISESETKLNDYLRDKYRTKLDEKNQADFTKKEKDLAMWNELATQFKINDNKWVATLGATGELGLKTYAIFGMSWIPTWGQLALLGYAIWNFGEFLGSQNPDDGIGAIRITCATINNFCLGTHTFSSQFNRNDADSINDYDLTFTVQELPVSG